MINKRTAEELRKIADQLEALTDLQNSGAPRFETNTVLTIDKEPVAYLEWWQDGEQYVD